MSYKTNNATRTSFLESDKAKELRNELLEMIESPLYNTRVIASVDSDASFFAEKHMRFMSSHLTMDHSQYVKNLKLMTLLR